MNTPTRFDRTDSSQVAERAHKTGKADEKPEMFARFTFAKPSEMTSPTVDIVHPAVVVGAGPVGLTMALSLAHSGVPCVLIEDDEGIRVGSRALGMSRRTLEIWEALGAADSIRAHGKDWLSGRSFYRGKTILDFQMSDDEAIRNRPMFNIQQNHTEKYLVDAIGKRPDIDLRWQTKFLNVAQHQDHVAIEVETPAGRYTLRAKYLVACDGARSAVRAGMGLKLQGASYEATYVIADVCLDTDGRMERRCWFDPPSNPGLTILMHGQPDKLWRLDYQLGEGEDVDAAVDPANAIPRIQAHLDYIGEKGKWTLEWISPYRVHSRALDSFRHDRVFFAGDAAHLMPIFGIRGLNSGVEDAWNLGWKIGQVHRRLAGDALLDSYTAERRKVFSENAALAERNACFMTPPDSGVKLMRDAVLSLAMNDAPVADILNPKQASYVPLRASILSSEDSHAFDGGPAPGEVVPDLQWAGNAKLHLQGILGNRFSLIYFAGDGQVPEVAATKLKTLENKFPDLKVLVIANQECADLTTISGATVLLHQRFAAAAGTTYLVRPDHNVAARWRLLDGVAVEGALAKARGVGGLAHADSSVHAPLSNAEAMYRSIGNALSQVDDKSHSLLLSKIALMLAIENGNVERVQAVIGMAQENLTDSHK